MAEATRKKNVTGAAPVWTHERETDKQIQPPDRFHAYARLKPPAPIPWAAAPLLINWKRQLVLATNTTTTTGQRFQTGRPKGDGAVEQRGLTQL